MSTTGPGTPDDWDPNDTGAVPLGPEPVPTGAGGAGSGGWGEAPRTEPFAVAALVWAIVSVVLPIVGTIVAFVLAARASDSIKRSRGARSGEGLVTAARIVAGAVIVLWAIGLILFVALDDGSDTSNVAVPTQPSASSTTSSSSSTTTTTSPATTTTTLAPVTTTQPVAPTTSILPPPTDPPPTQPTIPATTTTEAVTTTTQPPPSTTTPEQGEEARIQNQLLKTTGNPNRRIGPSNRDLPDDERIVVTYVPGETLQVSWAVNNGQAPLPQGDPDCVAPPSTSTTTTTLPDDEETTTTTAPAPSSTTQPGTPLTTSQLARREARNILNVLKTEIQAGRLNVDGVRLVGTYPVEGPDDGDVDVVQVVYANDDVIDTWPYLEAFDVPPASQLQCLNPLFD